MIVFSKGEKKQEMRFPPKGWQIVESRTRPGVLVYRNEYYRKRLASYPKEIHSRECITGKNLCKYGYHTGQCKG